MTGKFLLIVSDKDGGSRAEVAMIDTAQETERRVESLLAAGLDPDQITVFTGGQTGVKVTQRPVVHLMKRDSGEDAGSTVHQHDLAEREPVAVGAHTEQGPAAQDDGIDSALATDRIPTISRSRADELRNEAVPVPVAAVSYSTQPVAERRFSDLFKQA